MAKKNTTKKEEEIMSEVTATPEPVEASNVSGTTEKETVEISKKDLAELFNRLDSQAKDIDMLYKASDKNRLARAQGEGGEVLIKKVRVWTWDNTDKIVVGTSLVTNRSEVILGKWVEDQNIVVVFEDGTTETVPYLQFIRKTLNKIPAEITATSKSLDNNRKEVVIHTVMLPNGKELKINSSFVN